MFIKRPGGQRKSYALVRGGKTLYDPRIDAVNRDLKRNVPVDELEARMRQIRDSFKTNQPLNLSFTNFRVVDELHADKLRRKGRSLVDPYTLKRALIRAVEALGPLSLREASEDELINHLAKIADPWKAFYVTKGINELLRYLERGFSLYNPKPMMINDVTYITLSDFSVRVRGIEDARYRLVLEGLFATGCRWGELPVATFNEQGSVAISHQIDKSGVRRLTKNRRAREAPLIPALIPSIVALNALGRDALADLRLHHTVAIRRTCQAHLNLKIHDLRHSYAIAYAERGADAHQVADYIGDTVEVCQRHYLTHFKTSRQIKVALALWD